MSFFRSIDLFLLIPMMLLLSTSILVLFSVAPHLLPMQIAASFLSLLCFLIISRLDAHVFLRFAPYLYLGAVILLAITLFWGFESRGSIRWIPIGPYRFQTSEFAKPVFIIAFSTFLLRFPPRTIRHVLVHVGLLLPPFLLTARQPDLGSAMVILAVWGLLLFLGRLRWQYAAIGILLLAPLLPFSWNALHDYQQTRILTYLNPYRDPLGAGYSALQSQIAVGSGGFFGRGLGKGIQSHLQFLPEHATDFVFASFAEEFGFVGVLGLLFLYGWLLARLIRLSFSSHEWVGMLVVSGVAGLFFAQMSIHIGMNMGLLPITGITLPFLSYGGSSVVSFGISLGLASSVSRFSQGKRQTINNFSPLENLNDEDT
ncbi:MAG: FtsW/RodA/SpoVE family cell cycle protein [bacterium]|nr:FtsW/RodA/SpoVE family cell cycle protein [bacterium]